MDNYVKYMEKLAIVSYVPAVNYFLIFAYKPMYGIIITFKDIA